MRKTLDARSMLLGALLAVAVLAAVGATKSQPEGKEILPLRFRVVEVTKPQVEWQHGGDVVILRLKPYYGKISQESSDWRLKHETQDLTFVTIVERGYEIQKDDALGFQAYQHLRLAK